MRRLPRRHLSMPQRYGLAALMVLAASGIRLALPVIGLPYLFFIPPVMAVAFLLGNGPGLFATALATLLAVGLFIPPTTRCRSPSSNGRRRRSSPWSPPPSRWSAPPSAAPWMPGTPISRNCGRPLPMRQTAVRRPMPAMPSSAACWPVPPTASPCWTSMPA
ncbi:hypothetical protein ACFQU7_10715 [Pseudoroseomonas wenyumeiae]